MSILNLFAIPIYREPPIISTYDTIQLEIDTCLNTIKKTKDYAEVSHIYKPAIKEKSKFTHIIADDLIGKFRLLNLEAKIYEAVNNYSKAINPFIAEECGTWKIRNSWMNIAVENSHHDYHNHPGYTIAGTYYFRVSELQGGINFNNPNLMMYSHQFPASASSPGSINITPTDGEVILFPAWLQHSTDANMSTTEERISISFNLDYELNHKVRVTHGL